MTLCSGTLVCVGHEGRDGKPPGFRRRLVQLPGGWNGRLRLREGLWQRLPRAQPCALVRAITRSHSQDWPRRQELAAPASRRRPPCSALGTCPTQPGISLSAQESLLPGLPPGISVSIFRSASPQKTFFPMKRGPRLVSNTRRHGRTNRRSFIKSLANFAVRSNLRSGSVTLSPGAGLRFKRRLGIPPAPGSTLVPGDGDAGWDWAGLGWGVGFNSCFSESRGAASLKSGE